MAYRDLSAFIERLREHDQLLTVEEFVDPVLEIAEITDRFSKLPGGGKALLFTNTGTDFPVFTNAMGSDKRMALAIGVKNISEIEERIQKLLLDIREPRKGFFEKLSLLPTLSKIAGYFPSQISGKAACQEVVITDPDLSILPVLKTWPYDGGKFFTLPLVFTIDPETGERNVGMYRMQVFNRNTTGMHWHRHKTGANHYDKYKRLGKKMPVAVALGGDPAIIYSATAPLPENIDELLLAGFLREKSVSLVKCITQDIQVPAFSEIILEGYVDPEEEKIIEGPFGDHTGFYSLEDLYPVFHITAITHRKNAIFPATLVGIPPQEDAWIAKATERIFIMPIRQAIAPEIVDMYIPEFGVAHNLTIVSIRKSYPGQAKKVMNALWGAGQMMFNKVLIVCDEDVNIHDPSEVFEKLLTIDHEIPLSFAEGPLDVLDHSSDFTGYGSKLGIDLTTPFEEESARLSPDSKVIPHGEPDFSGVKAVKDTRIIRRGKYLRVALVSILKDQDYSASGFRDDLQSKNKKNAINVFLLTDDSVNLDSFEEFLWYFLNNLEPQRDIFRINHECNDTVLVIDGTSKNYITDNFRRDWPNPVIMDSKTIERIDKNWNNFNLGPFISSPSVHYNKLVRNPGARAFTNRPGS